MSILYPADLESFSALTNIIMIKNTTPCLSGILSGYRALVFLTHNLLWVAGGYLRVWRPHWPVEYPAAAVEVSESSVHSVVSKFQEKDIQA